ncbi:HD-GYP domain-containing protein [Marinospirillum alkaliphilum]|uniref:HDIG domain-containing protein n=1 Tax=Marinospirillum alkaliphilum DSM 21637 TaxID=1122209 RepID=A0A1K1XEC8_9GAMM|nr:HD-GYP domain-containing protein [Marinospirillum alkaliphilum]SFX47942.1 HDIG domain-containing protein [Marinospirillum alkaliphilum DSM 21637]
MLKVIPVDQIQVGMFISEQNAEWIPEQNRTKSGLIMKPETITKIRQRGIEFVTIDTDRGIDSEDRPMEPSIRNREAAGQRNLLQQEQSGVASPSVSLEDERTKAQRIHTEALQLLDNVMDRVRGGVSIDVAEVESVAENLVDSVFRNENALACLSRIRNKDAYLMEHSLNVGVLLSILAKSMGFDIGTIRKLAVGGMLHDVGKVQVPDEVLHKPGKLEAEEWEEMKRHVMYGEAYLEQIAVDSTVRAICAQHHERLDSSGYPRGLAADAISLFGRMSAVCDVYDAITADRCYHQGMAPSVAMKRLVEWSDDHLDRKLVYQFIRAMSIYPVGTLVELNNGHLGIVVEPNRVQQAKPRVRVIYHLKHRSFLPVEDIDLAHAGEDYAIVRALEPSRLDVQIKIMDFM